MNPVRLGVIGCGVIGRVHLQAAKDFPLIEVAAIADLLEDARRNAADDFGVKTVYPDGNALLDDPGVEAVILATPAGVRTPLALRAFEKGKHVLIEKPVAMNAGEVRKMIEARGDRVGACCSSRHRFQPSAKAAADLIAGGALGELRVLHCRNLSHAGGPATRTPPPWRQSKSLNGGGILVNWGCYDMDYLLGLSGWSLKPRTILAQSWPVLPQFAAHVAPGSDADSHYAALILCEGGAVISMERAEFLTTHNEDAWQIVGTKGSLRLHMTPAQGKKIVNDDGSTDRGMVSTTIWEGDEDVTPCNTCVVEDFAAAIRNGRQPMTNLEQALVVQQITDAIYASSDEGRAVTVT